ncbi:MAG: response regulator [Gammaproteobacteria bacterium]|nr:response regulator [Gammaproteobacteria bacterium]
MNQAQTNIRVMIVDDEPLARQGLRLRLQQLGDIEVVGEAGNGRDALQRIEQLQPDVLFLDIQMPGMTGLQLVQKLQQKHAQNAATELPLVVFITAYDDYAVRAFAEQALDYLLKPVDDERLTQSLQRVRGQLQQRDKLHQHQQLQKLLQHLQQQHLQEDRSDEQTIEELAALHRLLPAERMVFKDGHKTLRIKQADIRWIEAAGDYMCLQTKDTTHVVRATMKSIESKADPTILQRVHRSTMVNIQAIQSLIPYQNGEYMLTMDCGKQIKLSRHYRNKLDLLQST